MEAESNDCFPSRTFQLLQWISNYSLIGFSLLSFTLFLPTICFEFIDYNIEGASTSRTFDVQVTCVVIALPFLIDALLDKIFGENAYILYRLLLMSIIVVSYAVPLMFRGQESERTIALICSGWVQVTEIFLFTCILRDIVPEYFPIYMSFTLNILVYITHQSFNLSLIGILPRYALIITFQIASLLLFIILAGFAIFSIICLIKEYRISKESIAMWFTTIDSRKRFGISLTIIGGFLLLISITLTGLENLTLSNNNTKLTIELANILWCFFVYCLLSRLFRHELLDMKKDLAIKTEFIKYISHELRSPASCILFGLEQLEEHIIVDSAKTTVTDLKASMETVVEILDDLLIYEKLERQTLVTKTERFRTIKLFHFLLEGIQNDVIIMPFIDENTLNECRVLVDRNQIKMAFCSILKYCRQGDKTGPLEVFLKLSDCMPLLSQKQKNRSSKISPFLSRMKRRTSCQMLTIGIKDYRSGNKCENVQQLMCSDLKFERMGHADGEGSGFGLWIAKNILTFNNANICVSEINNGLLFEISIPIATVLPSDVNVSIVSHSSRKSIQNQLNSDHPLNSTTSDNIHPIASIQRFIDEPQLCIDQPCTEDELIEKIEKSSKIKPIPPISTILSLPRASVTGYSEPSYRCIRVLIVDDSSMILKMTCSMLQSIGFHCTTALDGAQAVDVVQKSLEDENEFDLILMDNQMPVMVGTEATRLIRRLGFTKPIFGVTGNALEEDIVLFLNSGVNCVIIKPLTKEKLISEYEPYMMVG